MKKARPNTVARKRSKISSHQHDGIDLLESLITDDAHLRQLADEATLNAMIAQLIYRARTDAGFTQANLAKLVGTRQSVISRLEDADYDGHSLSMLRRIAEALGKCLEVRFIDVAKRAA